VFVTVNAETNEVDLDGLVLYRDQCNEQHRQLCDPWVWMKAKLTIEEKQ